MINGFKSHDPGLVHGKKIRAQTCYPKTGHASWTPTLTGHGPAQFVVSHCRLHRFSLRGEPPPKRSGATAAGGAGNACARAPVYGGHGIEYRLGQRARWRGAFGGLRFAPKVIDSNRHEHGVALFVLSDRGLRKASNHLLKLSTQMEDLVSHFILLASLV